MMDVVQSVALGMALGVVVIVVLRFFPGDPFDYETNGVPSDASDDSCCTKKHDGAIRAPEQCSTAGTSTTTTTTSAIDAHAQRVREVERAAQAVKVKELQQLLGLEKSKVQELINRAKEDAINGVQPRQARDYGVLADYAFYALMVALLVAVLWKEYNVDVFRLLAQAFPRESEALGKVAAIPAKILHAWSQ